MNDTLQLAENVSSGLSDPVLLSIIAGLVTISTLITNAIIQARVKKAEIKAAADAAAVASKLDDVAIKIDGRLTQLLKISVSEAEERGQRVGKEEEKKEEKERKTNGGSTEKTPPKDEPKI